MAFKPHGLRPLGKDFGRARSRLGLGMDRPGLRTFHLPALPSERIPTHPQLTRRQDEDQTRRHDSSNHHGRTGQLLRRDHG